MLAKQDMQSKPRHFTTHAEESVDAATRLPRRLTALRFCRHGVTGVDGTAL